jgi:nucleoside phosphorylase
MLLINMKNSNEELLGKFNEWVEMHPKSWLEYLSPYKFARDMLVGENDAVLFFNELYKNGYAKAHIVIKCPYCAEDCIVENEKLNEEFECDDCGGDFIPQDIRDRLNVIYSLNMDIILDDKSSKINPFELLNVDRKDKSSKVVDINLMRDIKGEVYKVENKTQESKCDIAIVTALADLELRSVLSLPAGWEEFSIQGDDTVYYKGVFKGERGELKVVAACTMRMGMPPATALSMKLISLFSPEYIAIVGIAAGVKGGKHFGDILITDETWDWGSGKTIHNSESGETIFESSSKHMPLNGRLFNKFKKYETKRGFIDTIQEEYQGDKDESIKLNIHIGPTASGSSVLSSQPDVDKIKIQNRKLIGIEMEAYGVFCAAEYCGAPKPLAFSIKSISDFGDNEKKDSFRKYAAYTSSRFLYNFAINELIK